MLISLSWGIKSPRPSLPGKVPQRPVLRKSFQNEAGRDWGPAALEKPLICTELQRAPAHTNTGRSLVLLREVNCLLQGHRVKRERRDRIWTQIWKKATFMLFVFLLELPLLDLVRAVTFFHLLTFSNSLYLLSPKRKLCPCETHLQRLKPLQIIIWLCPTSY